MNRFYKINSLINEFRGAQCLDAETLSPLSDINRNLNKSISIKDSWMPVNFHSIGPISPLPSLFSIYSTATLAYRSSFENFPLFTDRMALISEPLNAFLEGEPITILHFLNTVDVLDFAYSDTRSYGGVNLTNNPVFLSGIKVDEWCFFVKTVGGSIFTQGTGPGTFIDFYLKNKMTGLEFVPQRFSSDDPKIRIG